MVVPTKPENAFVTDDSDFKNLSYGIFDTTFEERRLRILNLKAAFNDLFNPYFDHTRVKPYRRLRDASDEMARAKAEELREFVSSRLTHDMIGTSFGDTIIKILNVERVDIRGVDLPFPEEPPTNVTIDVTIKVTITCKVVMATDLSAFAIFTGQVSGPAAPPTEREKVALALGVVQASGVVVDGDLRELHLVDLAKDDF